MDGKSFGDIASVGLDIDSALRLLRLVKSGPLGWLYMKL